MESYLDLALCSVLHLRSIFINGLGYSVFSTVADFYCSLMAIFSIIIIIGLPFYIIIIIIENFKNEEIEQKMREENIHSLFIENILSRHILQCFFHAFFMLRRLIAIIIFVFQENSPYFQVIELMMMSILNLSYMLTSRPFNTVRENRIEIINEVCYLLMTYLFSVIVNQAIDVKMKTIIGWVMIVAMSLVIILNLQYQFFETFGMLLEEKKRR
jgi:hypothetical protein